MQQKQTFDCGPGPPCHQSSTSIQCCSIHPCMFPVMHSVPAWFTLQLFSPSRHSSLFFLFFWGGGQSYSVCSISSVLTHSCVCVTCCITRLDCAHLLIAETHLQGKWAGTGPLQRKTGVQPATEAWGQHLRTRHDNKGVTCSCFMSGFFHVFCCGWAHVHPSIYWAGVDLREL